MRRMVLLPEPEGPTSTRNSPSPTVKSRPIDGADAAGIGLAQVFERDVRPWRLRISRLPAVVGQRRAEFAMKDAAHVA